MAARGFGARKCSPTAKLSRGDLGWHPAGKAPSHVGARVRGVRSRKEDGVNKGRCVQLIIQVVVCPKVFGKGA